LREAAEGGRERGREGGREGKDRGSTNLPRREGGIKVGGDGQVGGI
jgi:hypothetical protein